jgi:hypothetical protein
MAVPDAFLGQALLTVHAPGGGGSEAVVEVIPAAGHTRVAPGGKATDAAPPAAPLRLTALLAANGTASLAYEARSYANDLTPQAVFVNGMPCAVTAAPAAVPDTPSPPPNDDPSIPGLSSFAAERPLTIRDGAIIGVDGAPLIVKGVNWFGYENGQTNPDGLWGNVGNGKKEGRRERESGDGRARRFFFLSRALKNPSPPFFFISLPFSPRRRLCQRGVAHAADGLQHHPPALLLPAV